MEDKKVKPGPVYYLIMAGHWVFIAAWLTSPFWLWWPWLLMVTVLMFLQSKYLGYCVATRWQFGKTDVSFWVYYLGKIGIKITKDQVTVYTRRFFVISVVTAAVWQTVMW